MDNKKLIQYSFVHSVGVFAYILFVSLLMNNAKYLVDKVNDVIGGAMFLSLFVLSATVVGSLIFARPIMMYLDGNKKEAIKLLFYTVAWLFVLLALIVTSLIFLK
ncbi:MAG: hypothetical protein WA057_02460 [Candidatus Magasanikiibacteriota bacterium]